MKNSYTISCLCSYHGNQKIRCFVFAGLILECGCMFVSRTGGIVLTQNVDGKTAGKVKVASGKRGKK